MPQQLIWLILLLPVISFAINALIVRPLAKPENRISGYITIAAIAGSFVLSVWAFITVYSQTDHIMTVDAVSWVTIGDFSLKIGILLDSLTAVMLLVITSVSLLVQIYSQSYMQGDKGYTRYYTWMSLFTASMLGLVLVNNLLMLYVFWEMVGLCSYLLIGFWFHLPSAANAAKKAFIITRLGDLGLLAAILILYANYGTFDIAELHTLALAGVVGGTVLTWALIGIFAGAAGKSAQFPLHTWLPDAMEGPTPVSALIHAATMVAAGVYLIARTLPLFQYSTVALNTVAIIGGFTAIFAASMGLVAVDIKRVLAYSTISQLGYMMLGLATGGVAVGMFHLFNHAFFKALLFLGSGSVHHATKTFDMRKMGGLRKIMPWTFGVFVIGSLSLAGIWPLAGFWSKDEVLASAFANQPVLFVLAIITVFMTAFYMFRVVFLTFGGESRAIHDHDHNSEHAKGHESPKMMLVPMVILAVLAVISGLWNVTGGFNTFMGEENTAKSFVSGFFGILAHPLPLISLLVAALGIFLAYAMYSAKWVSAEKIGQLFKPVYNLFYNKYWMDDLYEKVIVKGLLLGGIFNLSQWFDSHVVDGSVNGVGTVTLESGKTLRRLQTGQTQVYILTMIVGVIAIIVCTLIFAK